MFTEKTVAVITAATGHPKLAQCLQSVQNQTYPTVEHWVITDGPERQAEVARALHQLPELHRPIRTLLLPQPTGKENWCGHRIYGAASYLVNTEFICFLDEDNWFDADHVESLHRAITAPQPVWNTTQPLWAFALRKIVDQEGNLVTEDKCESLGNLHPLFSNPNDFRIDANCYFFRRETAVMCSSLWYGQTRSPKGIMGPDRAICRYLLMNLPQVCCNLKHTVNYRVGNRPDSVTADFFLQGNEMMRRRYPGGMPWEVRKG